MDDSCLWELYTGDNNTTKSNKVKKCFSPHKTPKKDSLYKIYPKKSPQIKVKNQSPCQLTLKESFKKTPTKLLLRKSFFTNSPYKKILRSSPRLKSSYRTPSSSPKKPMEIVNEADDSILWQLYKDDRFKSSANCKKNYSPTKMVTSSPCKSPLMNSMDFEACDSLDTYLWNLCTNGEKKISESSPKQIEKSPREVSVTFTNQTSKKTTNRTTSKDSSTLDLPKKRSGDNKSMESPSKVKKYQSKKDSASHANKKSTPSSSKSSLRKPLKPSKSISPKDKTFKGVSFLMTPSVKGCKTTECSSDVLINSKLSKGSLKRHNSMTETFSGQYTPLCKLSNRLTNSEPRPKRKIDTSINGDSPDECTSKKKPRCLQLEENRPRSCIPFFADSPFFIPILNADDFKHIGIAPIKHEKKCTSCGTSHTPLWRDAEDGTHLCNACGIRWKKHRIRCTRCWYIPLKDEKRVPYCSRCGMYNTVKRCNTFRRYVSSIY